ncbi:beta strand repeat-containing protein, partial [Falsiroseomonas sp.]|uniref:beta strand repeat-containing protein n=1 Tax=Falsiroseomonas sp. TaxID=2870721 RepID=UPI003F6F3F48
GGSIRLAGSLASALARVDFVEFADGTVWDVAQLLALSTTSNGGNDAFNGSDLADTLDGGAGADTLLGGSGADTLRGGTGNDALDGGGEADRFIYEAGDGDDTISTAGFDFDVNDRLLLGAGITTADVTVTQENGTDFLLAIAGGGSIRLAGSLASALARVDFVEFADGTVWTQANLLARSMLANSGNDSFYGDENDNTLDGGAGGDTLLAGVGADTLDGGTGNDSLLGGAGNDVFLYDLGDGNDTINDFSFDSPSHDRLVLGAGILTSQVTVAQGGAGDDFILTMPDGSTVTLLISLTNSFGRIEEVEFADGTTWDQAALLARSIVDNAGHDAFSGDEFDNPLAGGAGNDTISANSGADSITGGTGNDLLLGAYGADRYYYALGDGSDTISDSAIGDSSTDRLVLGAGILTSHVAVSQADGGSDFVLTLAGGATIRLDGGLGQAENRIEEVEFADGTIWDHAELLARSLIAVATTGDDNILGDASDNGLDGLGGNDTIAADAGADTIAASGGNDSVDGGTGTDCFVLTGSRGDYAVTQLPGGAIRLVDLRGGSPDGTDIVIAVEEFAFSDQTLSAAQVLVGVPTVSGDRILGGSLDDGIEGLDGNDTIYGQAGADTLAGGSGNDILVGGAGVDRMVGGSGNDVFYVDDAADAVEEAAGEGTDWILSSVTLTLGTAVENLTLTGGGSIDGTGNTEANRITGNAGANRLSGSGGNDTLTGGLGADTLEGGSGNDVFYVDDGGDLVTEAAGEGTDWIFSSVTVTLGAAVENLILTGTADIDGTGNTGANRITGNAGANRLSGSGGNDTITGGAGADTLEGGTGNDAFYVDEAGDEVVELAGEGTDVVLASIDYALGAAVENLSLTGTVDIDGTGNTEANRITGNAGANRLSGSGGNDTITGGAGADTLEGGTGNDVFYVDEAGDEVVELAGEGTDVVLASIDYALGAAVENLSLTGTADIDGTGNTEANRITGNAGANRLSGSGGNDTLTGGLGADTLEGGAGNDVFYVDDGGDLVTEAAGEGTDWMFSSVTVTLGAGVENLILTGTADIDGTGNTEANRITGNAGANRLSGSGGNDTITGGAGADTQEGGTGNDAFYVDEAGDEVVELAGEGTDVVLASIDYALGAAVENLSLTGTADLDGTGNTTGNSITGNAGANRMEGLSGNDTLAGAGGADTLDGGGGVDRLSGGIGADVFRFQSLAESPASSPDTVADFVRGEDLLDVSAIDPRADAGDQDFAWIGGAAFDGLGVAQARTWQLGLETYVGFDIGDGGSAELVIRLSGLLAMTADDLIL